eukprot:scaffold649914_cov39-Prasinocladus_malaysianus.AAC.1
MLARSTIDKLPKPDVAEKTLKSGPTAVNIRSTFTVGVAGHRDHYRSQQADAYISNEWLEMLRMVPV